MIYLSGGLHSNWQDKFQGLPVIDPRNHRLTDPTLIQDWMVANISTCDMVVAYLEEDNPGGYNMAFEIGVATTLDIPVFIVDEKKDRYFQIVKADANEFENIDELLDYVQSLLHNQES